MRIYCTNNWIPTNVKNQAFFKSFCTTISDATMYEWFLFDSLYVCVGQGYIYGVACRSFVCKKEEKSVKHIGTLFY